MRNFKNIKTKVITLSLLFTFSLCHSQFECQVGPDVDPPLAASGTCLGLEQYTFQEASGLPIMETTVLFHLRANSNNINFSSALPDPNIPWDQTNGYNYIRMIFEEMNNISASSLEESEYNQPPSLLDSRLRFKYAGENLLNSVKFYNFNQPLQLDPNVLNVIFDGGTGTKYQGATNFHSNAIYNYNGQHKTIVLQEWTVTAYGRQTLHENGHTMTLDHSFHCSNKCHKIAFDVYNECHGNCHNNNSNNGPSCWNSSNMIMGYGSSYKMSICELNIMYKDYFSNPKPYRTLVCTPEMGSVDIASSSPITWQSNKYFVKDIRIKSGTQLTIKCNVFMSEGRRIIVEECAKLIVDGGKITSFCSNWQGIKVYGGNSDFDVKFTNNAIIENTSAAAVSMFAPEPWPQIQQWCNGILHAENTTFNNTRRIVEMMAWKPSFNKSYIRDCVQNGGKWSITNWNCIGVEVKDNVFNNITDVCIGTETGQFLIEGNEFHSVNNDIVFANVSPGFGTIIRQNDFYGASTGIRSIGTTIAQNEIRKNQFLTGEFDIFMDGVNSYLIEGNDITSDFGAISIDNGIHSNDVFDNRLTGNFIGLAPLGSNQDYTFYRNCFTTSFADSYIDGQITGIVSAGTEGAANNCFTHQGNTNNIVFDITGNPSPFDYVEPNKQNYVWAGSNM